MRKAILAVAVLALAASCSPKAGDGKTEGGESSSGGGLLDGAFPKSTASYMARYTLNPGGTAPREMTIYASGGQRRMESAPPSAMSGKALAMATVMDSKTKQWVNFPVGPDAPKIATVINAGDMAGMMDQFEPKEGAVPPKTVGSDKVAGLDCRVWEMASTIEGKPPSHACVTGDGIMLRMGEAGAASPTMIATEVKKGAQDPALFAVPAGYEVVDMGPCMAIMATAVEAAKAGKKLDMAKMAECQTIMAKAGGMYGGR